MKSNLRNNLDSITNDVSNLFKKIGDPNDKILKRSMESDAAGVTGLWQATLP